MFKQTVYLVSFILFLFAFMSCQNSTTEPEIMNSEINNLQRDRAGQVDVGGIVYKSSSPQSGVLVELYKGSTWLEQDETDGNGYYEINVCGHNQGAGVYKVIATKYYREVEWCDSEDFYWDGDTEPCLIEVDLYLTPCDQK